MAKVQRVVTSSPYGM